MEAFSTDNLAALCEERGLVFPRSLLGHLVTAIRVGKHVALTGPPGTGKTTLAYLAAELGRHALLCAGSIGVTASREWDTSVTIGRYHVSREGVAFQPGLILDAIQTGNWLVIDELNRADFDQAFGPLFTVLAGQAVTLPFKLPGHERNLAIVPPDVQEPDGVESIRVPGPWRIIATMNAFDKELLYRLSHALMRRFAFIDVASPPDAAIEAMLPSGGALVRQLFPVREFVDLGPAVFLDAARYAAERLRDREVSPSRVLFEVFASYFAPQLDGLDPADGERLVRRLAVGFDPPEQLLLRQAVATLLAPGNLHPAPARPVALVADAS